MDNGAVSTGYPFLKGHGTENDFVLLPDHDGTLHGDLDAARVRALCDRRAGIGGDGVLRVIRTAAYDVSQAADAEWYMDYRNSDGSVSEMCGNGIRVFARHLVEEGLADPSATDPGGHPRRDQDAHRSTATWSPPTWDTPRPWARPRCRSAPVPGPPATSTWATRTRSLSSTTSPTPATCCDEPTHDEALYPAGRERRVRGPRGSSGTSRCASTSAGRARPAPAAPARAR